MAQFIDEKYQTFGTKLVIFFVTELKFAKIAVSDAILFGFFGNVRFLFAK